MIRRAAVLASMLLLSCGKPAGERSLVGDFAAPGTHAVARDTIVVWQRLAQPDGSSLFRSYAITPGGAVQLLEHQEHSENPASEEAPLGPERRKEFALPAQALERIRGLAVRLRPLALGPADAAGGYGGEAVPLGCAATPRTSGESGVNFINDANWGAFVLPAACGDEAARAAMRDLFHRLDEPALRAPFTP